LTLQVFIKSPGGETDESLTEAERLRAIFTIITSPIEEGGAGITPGFGHWEQVESIFPLSNTKFTSVSTVECNFDCRNGFTIGLQSGW
jgi:hypothetical protein